LSPPYLGIIAMPETTERKKRAPLTPQEKKDKRVAWPALNTIMDEIFKKPAAVYAQLQANINAEGSYNQRVFLKDLLVALGVYDQLVARNVLYPWGRVLERLKRLCDGWPSRAPDSDYSPSFPRPLQGRDYRAALPDDLSPMAWYQAPPRPTVGPTHPGFGTVAGEQPTTEPQSIEPASSLPESLETAIGGHVEALPDRWTSEEWHATQSSFQQTFDAMVWICRRSPEVREMPLVSPHLFTQKELTRLNADAVVLPDGQVGPIPPRRSDDEPTND
jgi:hypothetical protein